jgi:hypothetical protein
VGRIEHDGAARVRELRQGSRVWGFWERRCGARRRGVYRLRGSRLGVWPRKKGGTTQKSESNSVSGSVAAGGEG